MEQHRKRKKKLITERAETYSGFVNAVDLMKQAKSLEESILAGNIAWIIRDLGACQFFLECVSKNYNLDLDTCLQLEVHNLHNKKVGNGSDDSN